MYRVDELADREVITPQKVPFGEVSANVLQNRVPYINLVSLDEVLGEAFGVGRATKTVKTAYQELIRAFGSELTILIDTPLSEIARIAKPEVVEALKRTRNGELIIDPGYDGEFGTVKIFSEEGPKAVAPQKSLF
jgi:DNA helicase-2/ATP-dependent DNA helicase PcrA